MRNRKRVSRRVSESKGNDPEWAAVGFTATYPQNDSRQRQREDNMLGVVLEYFPQMPSDRHLGLWCNSPGMRAILKMSHHLVLDDGVLYRFRRDGVLDVKELKQLLVVPQSLIPEVLKESKGKAPSQSIPVGGPFEMWGHGLHGFPAGE